jgi:hypothetical protein
MKQLLKNIATIALGCLIGVVGALLLLEWAAGCGETYIDSKGVTHANDCVFLPIKGDTDAK